MTFIHLHHSLEEKKTQIKMKFKHSESILQDYNNSKPELPTPGIYSKHPPFPFSILSSTKTPFNPASSFVLLYLTIVKLIVYKNSRGGTFSLPPPIKHHFQCHTH